MQVHGHNVDKFKGRFTGTIDEVEEEDFRFDQMVVLVVLVRPSFGGIDPRDDGEVHATVKIKVTDMAPLKGEMRDQAIRFLAGGSTVGLIDFGQSRKETYADPPPTTVESGTNGATGEITRPPGVDFDGELVDDVFDVPVAPPLPVVPRPDDADPPAYKAPPEPVPVGQESAPPPAGAQRVGSVYGRGREGRKDSDLAAFLEE